MPATRYYTQRCANAMEVAGLGAPGQKLADCSALSANPGAGIPLWTSPRLCAPSARLHLLYQPGEFHLSRGGKCRSPHTLREECIWKKPPLTWDVQVAPHKSFRKIRITALWRQRHVCSLCQKSKLFFPKSQAHCSCCFGSRESIPYSKET